MEAIHPHPRWASRITLNHWRRVERLQAITEADAQAEGVERIELTSGIIEEIPPPFNRVHPMTSTYRDAFAKLWDKINGRSMGIVALGLGYFITSRRSECGQG